MEKVRSFINRWGLTIMLPILIITNFKSCSNSRELEVIKTEIKAVQDNAVTDESISEKLDGYATRKDVKDEMERTMLDFLIYEDELDKKKITISQIKEKIEAND